MITVDQASKLLGISKRMMYDLAAPHGKIDCFRIGTKILFEESDIERYKLSCRHTTIQKEVAGYLSSTKLSMGSESGLLKLFRKAGTAARQKPLTNQKQTDSMGLRLVQPNQR